MADYFGIRALYVLVCFGVLGGSLRIATDVIAVVSLFILFFVPLSLDYWTHTPKTASDTFRKKIGIRVPLTIFAIGITIIFIRVPFIDAFITYDFVKYSIWGFAAGPFVYLAFKDWIAYSSDEEYAYSAEVINTHRENVEETRINEVLEMDNKRKFYQGVKNTRAINAKKRKRRKGR